MHRCCHFGFSEWLPHSVIPFKIFFHSHGAPSETGMNFHMTPSLHRSLEKNIWVPVNQWKMHSQTKMLFPAWFGHTPLYSAHHFPSNLLPVSSFYLSIAAWHWSLHIKSGHRLIVRPTGSVRLQQSEGSTLPQTYFSVAQQPECHARRERNHWRFAHHLLSAGFWLCEIILHH